MQKNKKTRRAGPNAVRKAKEAQAKNAKIFGKLILIAAVAAGGYWIYAYAYQDIRTGISNVVMPKIAIDGYDIKGGEGLDSAVIANCLELDENANFFNTSTKNIAKNLAGIDGVEDVRVTKKPLSNVVSVKITKRAAKYQVNIENNLYWADKNGFLWKGHKNSDVNTSLIFGLNAVSDSLGKRIEKRDFEMLEKTFEKIRGGGRNSDNIKSIHFKGDGVVEFMASNVSVPVRINGTMKYGSDDFEYFESVLRKNNKTPMRYMDAYDNCIYSM